MGGYAADNSAAVHIVDDVLDGCVASVRGATVYSVRKNGSDVVEEALPTRFLGG